MERSKTRAEGSEDKELQKISECIADKMVPDDRRDPKMEALLNQEAVQDVPHVLRHSVSSNNLETENDKYSTNYKTAC